MTAILLYVDQKLRKFVHPTFGWLDPWVENELLLLLYIIRIVIVTDKS